ncbi:hypothetical protein A3G63_02020 [Candidatus Kaiserbacteria bacterium RIFCSPLOWO2_12_FULL_52_8]|uniref:Uncharacterized protein n=1 Tax=Candidatus Kaiserbacteria bacterium RIFCSPHIGHO2_01_FULL_53_31 TaxID=1798481 RepID=A0A1F6CHK0_9BACT|nr:MAG: hypothetical protein A2678_01665 [Candidatus Kaiserbacteria bacterium RIFCSPHIGHO2_01_FULL_53_31]OGG94156.1 MAG: hypothetical protein A3G63_02020 [Candidatus Kaiserbacteria bacterium RIFCSPLOWO2_12_FULL_52_8]
MGVTLRNWRVLGAACFSLAIVIGSYVTARGVASPPIAEASTETELLQAIASRDSDGDGLPDWEEALYGTDSHDSDTFDLGMDDGAAVAQGLVVPKAIADVSGAASTSTRAILTDPSLPIPGEGTLTAAFAKNFFALYLSAVQSSNDGNLSQTDMQNVASEALSQLAGSITLAPDFKSAQSLTISGSGPEALRTFAVSAEAVFKANKSSATKSEIFYLQDAIEGNDTTALAQISLIAKAYRSTATGLAVIPMPAELSSDDLVLINTMARVSEIAEDFTRVNDDPLATMLALQQYPQAVLDLGNAFIRIGNVYKTAGISLSAGEPGASFVNLIGNIAERQKASKSHE